MRHVTIEVTANLVTETCCNTSCGILFAVPEDWQQNRRRDHTSFYCPNGHSQSYLGKTREEELREKLALAERNLKRQEDRSTRLANDNMTLARSRWSCACMWG